MKSRLTKTERWSGNLDSNFCKNTLKFKDFCFLIIKKYPLKCPLKIEAILQNSPWINTYFLE